MGLWVCWVKGSGAGDALGKGWGCAMLPAASISTLCSPKQIVSRHRVSDRWPTVTGRLAPMSHLGPAQGTGETGGGPRSSVPTLALGHLLIWSCSCSCEEVGENL